MLSMQDSVMKGLSIGTSVAIMVWYLGSQWWKNRNFNKEMKRYVKSGIEFPEKTRQEIVDKIGMPLISAPMIVTAITGIILTLLLGVM